MAYANEGMVARLPALVGIGDAAQALGVSRTTVQKMVDTGSLEALRTTGGHRRIVRQSLERHLQIRLPSTHRLNDLKQLQVVIAEGDAGLREAYRSEMLNMGLPLDITMCSDAVDALLQVERRKPQVLIVNLSLTPFDGAQLLKILRDQASLQPGYVLATGDATPQQLALAGGIGSALRMPGTPNWSRIQGFLEACCLSQLGSEAVLSEQMRSQADTASAGSRADLTQF